MDVEHWLHHDIRFPKERAKRILLLHGFVGSPFDLKPLIDVLQKDYDLTAPLLPTPVQKGENTLKVVREHWIQTQPDAIIGFSMGGALTMLLPDCPKVILAPFRGLPWFNKTASFLADSLGNIISKVPKVQSGRIRYSKGRDTYKPRHMFIPTDGFLGLQNLVEASTKPTPNHPLLWIHSPTDPVACYRKAQKQWGEHAQHMRVENVDHVLLYEQEAPEIINRISDFLMENVNES